MGAGSHARQGAQSSRVLGVLAVVAVAAGAGVAWVSSPPPSASSEECAAAPRIELAAAPDIAPVVEQAAVELPGCAELVVTAQEPAETLQALLLDEGAPDLWVPDSAVWVQQLAAAGGTTTPVSPSVAASPVLLAGGPSVDAPDSWFAALASGRVSMRDPLAHGSAALALVAPRAERNESGVAPRQIQARLVPVAQRYGAQAASPDAAAADVLAGITATSQLLVPVTEQEFLTARRSNRAVTAVAPRTGVPLAQHPLVAAADADAGTLEAGEALAAHLAGEQGARLLAEHRFRTADGAPLLGGLGAGKVPELTLPKPQETLADLRVWEVLTVPSSILAVLDASGSMDFDAGGRTRMELAADAAGTALQTFPGHARVGLWLFSIDQGGPGVDHRRLAPLKRLDAKAAGTTQREALGGAIRRALGLTRGGTGLYDTTLAAYRAATEKYDPAYFNAVVILTDGANEDPGSLRLDQLLGRLRDEADPSRPVRIIAIGISEDADMEALTRIAEATNGSAYPARDPRDILAVISKALLAR